MDFSTQISCRCKISSTSKHLNPLSLTLAYQRPWSAIVLQKLTVYQSVKTRLKFCRTEILSTLFRTVRIIVIKLTSCSLIDLKVNKIFSDFSKHNNMIFWQLVSVKLTKIRLSLQSLKSGACSIKGTHVI